MSIEELLVAADWFEERGKAVEATILRESHARGGQAFHGAADMAKWVDWPIEAILYRKSALPEDSEPFSYQVVQTLFWASDNSEFHDKPWSYSAFETWLQAQGVA